MTLKENRSSNSYFADFEISTYRCIFATLRTLPTVIDLSNNLTKPFDVFQTRWVNDLTTETTLHERIILRVDLIAH